MWSGVDAWTSPEEHLISLSLDGVLRWNQAELMQVVRHEMAHLDLSVFLGNTSVPAWFEEGIAEWWAGGLTCEGATRIRLDLLQRRHDTDQMPVLFEPEGFEHSRLAYDYLASFFEYLNVRGGGIISDGRLLRAVKEHGVNEALAAGIGMHPAEIEEAWWRHVIEQYDSLPEGPIC